jgi:hypothetical protein
MYGQNGPVWYLESVLGGGTWTRDCTIPCDKALFFPTEACVADTVGFGPPLSVEQLRALCKRQVDKVNINNYVVTIDGQRLAGLDKLRFVTDVFAVTVPEDNIYDYMGVPWPAGVVFPVIADGYYVMLAPLPPGDHTLRVVYPGSLDMTYNLHIVALTLP